jgi:hypothetical protein
MRALMTDKSSTEQFVGFNCMLSCEFSQSCVHNSKNVRCTSLKEYDFSLSKVQRVYPPGELGVLTHRLHRI